MVLMALDIQKHLTQNYRLEFFHQNANRQIFTCRGIFNSFTFSFSPCIGNLIGQTCLQVQLVLKFHDKKRAVLKKHWLDLFHQGFNLEF